MSTIFASIVTYHTDLAELDACVRSLRESRCIQKVVIVDNASEERVREFAEQNSDLVEYIPHPNTGYGDAHNAAIKRSLEENIDFHLVINSDVYFDKDEFRKCVEYIEAHSDVGQLIPHTIYPDNREQYVCHPLPTPLDMVMRRFIPKRFMTRRRQRYDLTCYDLSQPVSVPYHHGCFMLLRTEALRKAGLFDPRYFMYPEDIDLTRRVHRYFKTIYYPYSTIVHAHRAASRTSRKMLYIHVSNMLKYFWKWGFFFDKERRKFNKQLFASLEQKKN